MAKSWAPDCWRSFPIKQQPTWPDEADLDRALKQIRGYPPLVFAGEARSLQTGLAQVAAGNAFLLQAGDCAESFEDFSANNIREKLRVILQMAIVLTYSLGCAGRQGRPHRRPVRQAALVRLSSGSATTDLPAFRGHIVNDSRPPQAARVPTAERLVQAYHQSASTLNLRARLHQGRLRRPRPGPRLDPGVRGVEPGRPAVRPAGARRSTAPCASCAPPAWTPSRTTRCARSTCGPATRRCSSATRRRSPGRTRPPAAGTTARRTCCGSASAPASSTAPTSSSCAASATRSAARSGRR